MLITQVPVLTILYIPHDQIFYYRLELITSVVWRQNPFNTIFLFQQNRVIHHIFSQHVKRYVEIIALDSDPSLLLIRFFRENLRNSFEDSVCCVPRHSCFLKYRSVSWWRRFSYRQMYLFSFSNLTLNAFSNASTKQAISV